MSRPQNTKIVRQTLEAAGFEFRTFGSRLTKHWGRGKWLGQMIAADVTGWCAMDGGRHLGTFATVDGAIAAFEVV
jgi:hypothetical protein